MPRAAAVQKLTIAAQRGEAAAGAAALPPAASLGPMQLQLVWSNLVSALTLMGPTLRHLVIDWPDELHLTQWVATLVALEVGGCWVFFWRGGGGGGGGGLAAGLGQPGGWAVGWRRGRRCCHFGAGGLHRSKQSQRTLPDAINPLARHSACLPRPSPPAVCQLHSPTHQRAPRPGQPALPSGPALPFGQEAPHPGTLPHTRQPRPQPPICRWRGEPGGGAAAAGPAAEAAPGGLPPDRGEPVRGRVGHWGRLGRWQRGCLRLGRALPPVFILLACSPAQCCCLDSRASPSAAVARGAVPPELPGGLGAERQQPAGGTPHGGWWWWVGRRAGLERAWLLVQASSSRCQ